MIAFIHNNSFISSLLFISKQIRRPYTQEKLAGLTKLAFLASVSEEQRRSILDWFSKLRLLKIPE